MENYYDILGVEESASDADIKKAYRSLAKEWHPDRNTDPEAKEKFQKINEANQVLSNKQKREQYDMQRKHGPQVRFGSDPFSGGGFDINDIINEMFGRRAQHQHQSIYQLTITFKEAFTGCTKHTNIDTVTIPAGIRNGSRLKVGNNLYSVRVLSDSKYERQNDHLITMVTINSFDAMLGNEIKYKHLDNNEIIIKIPPGIQHGEKLRVKGKGMPNPEFANRTGDLYVICFIETPNNLTAEEKLAILNIYKPTTLTL